MINDKSILMPPTGVVVHIACLRDYIMLLLSSLSNVFLMCGRYLLEQEYPGSRIGPEPTTDSFTAIMHGEIEGIIHGNALTADPIKPFRKLSPFGTTFLNR